MSRVAQRWALWENRGSPPTPGLNVGGPGTPPGVPILRNQFGLRVWLSIQIAWGFTPTSDMSTWVWSDVSLDVLYDDRIQITLGRADEASTPQPAALALTLKNKTGKYTYGPQSPNYPNITKNVPVQVIITVDGIPYRRFLGYSVGFTPEWDSTGNYAVVKLVAAGAKRRLNKGANPVQSVLSRSIPELTGLVEYWPMEDGSQANQIASGIPGGTAMQLGNGITTGVPTLASNSTIIASNALPVLGSGSFFGPVNSAAMNTGTLQVRFMAVWPGSGNQAPDGSEIISIQTPGSSVAFWWLLYHTGGSLALQGHASDGTVLYDSGPIFFAAEGTSQLVSVSFVQSGGNINAQIETYTLGAPTAGFINLPVTGQTLNPCTFISFAPNGDQTGLVVGHCTVSNQYQDIFNLLSQVNGYNAEYTGNRLDRLTAENGEHLKRTIGMTHELMGPQSPDTYINLMEGCAKVEDGVLLDGLDQGLTFIAHDERTSLPASLTLDASLGQIGPPLSPTDDDQLIINTYTATRTNGSSVTYVDNADSLAALVIGDYTDSTAQNFYQDTTQLADYASWQVHLRTTAGYRWPSVEIWLHRDPELLIAWLTTRLQSRVDLINLNAVRQQLYTAPAMLMMEGYTETIDQFLWDVVMNTTPYDPWRVAEIAAETGDTNEYVFRVETDGANVVTGVPAGSSSVSVSSLDTVWTTLADDFPLFVNMGGQKIKVTNITGSTSPQTFTVDPTTVTYPIPTNAVVTVWMAPVIDVGAM